MSQVLPIEVCAYILILKNGNTIQFPRVYGVRKVEKLPSPPDGKKGILITLDCNPGGGTVSPFFPNAFPPSLQIIGDNAGHITVTWSLEDNPDFAIGFLAVSWAQQDTSFLPSITLE